jgi:hypothetical protein
MRGFSSTFDVPCDRHRLWPLAAPICVRRAGRGRLGLRRFSSCCRFLVPMALAEVAMSELLEEVFGALPIGTLRHLDNIQPRTSFRP